MDFIPIAVFENYIDAHIAMGQLEESGIECWLKDENTVTMDPILTQAVGGIKLMVAANDVPDAMTLLSAYRNSREKISCPSCGSDNVEVVTTPRKMSNWLGAFVGMFLGSYALGVDKVYHCFDCGAETEMQVEPVE
jgi:hypothetical protein